MNTQMDYVQTVGIYSFQQSCVIFKVIRFTMTDSSNICQKSILGHTLSTRLSYLPQICCVSRFC